MKLKPNQERIDFVTDKDLDRLVTQFILKFGREPFSDIVSWAMANGYRMGVTRGIEMAKEADVYIEDGMEEAR